MSPFSRGWSQAWEIFCLLLLLPVNCVKHLKSGFFKTTVNVICYYKYNTIQIFQIHSHNFIWPQGPLTQQFVWSTIPHNIFFNVFLPVFFMHILGYVGLSFKECPSVLKIDPYRVRTFVGATNRRRKKTFKNT